jgi:competence protein ComEC
VAGLVEVARRFAIGRYFTNGIQNPTTSHALFENEASGATGLGAGDVLEFDGVRFEVLWPPDGFRSDNLNETSLVIRVTYGRTSFLLTGDAEGAALEAVVAAGTEVDVLKVPHHGSQTTPASFFAAMQPALAVISAGEGNVHGHPHESTLAALEGVRILRADLEGRVVIRSDGERLAVGTQR